MDNEASEIMLDKFFSAHSYGGSCLDVNNPVWCYGYCIVCPHFRLSFYDFPDKEKTTLD